jgi:hypothetical protein
MRPGIRVKRAPQAQSSGSKARAARPRSSDKQQDALLYFAFPGSPVPVTIVIMACQFDAQLRPQKPIVWGLDQCRSLLSASVQCARPTVCSRWLRSAVCKSPSAQRPIMTANANMSAMKAILCMRVNAKKPQMLLPWQSFGAGARSPSTPGDQFMGRLGVVPGPPVKPLSRPAARAPRMRR